MKKKANEINKRKKIKKVIIIESNKIQPINSSLKSIDSINNSLYPKINKNILKNNDKTKHNKLNKSQRHNNKINFPEVSQDNQNINSISAINIIDNSLISRNNKKLNTNHVTFHKSYAKTMESVLNNSLNSTNKKNFCRKINQSCIDFNKNKKERNRLIDTSIIIKDIDERRLFRNKTQSYIDSKKINLINLPNINNNKLSKSNKKKDIPVKKIYEYIIKKEKKNIIKPIKNFDKFINRKYKDPKMRFNKIYCINQSYIRHTKQFKNNRKIAYKKDFDINEYQNAILRFLENRVDSINLNNLGHNYREFNEKMNRKFSPKGRFTNLANKIMHHAPNYLVDKLRELDKNKLIKRAKFLKSNIDIDQETENKKEDYFHEFNLYMEKKSALHK